LYVHYNLACAFALLGENELALDRLDRIMGPDTMTSLREFMLNDSDLDPLRGEPRYAEMLKRLGI